MTSGVSVAMVVITDASVAMVSVAMVVMGATRRYINKLNCTKV